jgi:hypothetical protein
MLELPYPPRLLTYRVLDVERARFSCPWHRYTSPIESPPSMSTEYVVQTTRPLLAYGSGRMEAEGCCPSGLWT